MMDLRLNSLLAPFSAPFDWNPLNHFVLPFPPPLPLVHFHCFGVNGRKLAKVRNGLKLDHSHFVEKASIEEDFDEVKADLAIWNEAFRLWWPMMKWMWK